MNRLTERPQTHISINGKEYPLNYDYRSALLTQEALSAANDEEIQPLSACFVAIKFMLNIDGSELTENDRGEALKGIADYLHKYARISDSDKTRNDKKPPLLSLEQDAQMIYDAFQLLHIDLDSQDISYPRFMSLLRELPQDCQLCRIIYLRQQHQRNKLTKEEKEEINRRGRDIVYIRDKRKERAADDNAAYFKELQNKKRREKGLPPV